MSWQQRRPKPKIKIFTKKNKDLVFTEELAGQYDSLTAGEVFEPIEDVISIITSNGIGQASGTFRIELVYRTSGGESVYYNTITPMDIAIIYLDGSTTTMVGIIDTVAKSRSLSGGRIKRSVTLSGKSLGAIWEFDLVKYFENTAGIPASLLQRNLELQKGLIKLDFFGENLITAITTLYKALPAIDIQYKDKKLSDFIDVGSELSCRKDEVLYNLNTEPYMGTLWNYFKRYVGEPFNEIWTDSKDEKLVLRTRPTPFSMGEDGVEITGGANNRRKISGWGNINNWNSGSGGEVNTWGIPSSEVISENLSRTHEQSYSIYGVLPTDKLYGNAPEYQALPPLIIEEDYESFGSRDLIIRVGFIPLKAEGGLDEFASDIFESYRNRLYLWNKDNHRYERGTLTIMSRPLISAGDKIQYGDKEYYTTAIQHTWRYGQPMQSVVSVDRGIARDLREQYYLRGKKNL